METYTVRQKPTASCEEMNRDEIISNAHGVEREKRRRMQRERCSE